MDRLPLEQLRGVDVRVLTNSAQTDVKTTWRAVTTMNFDNRLARLQQRGRAGGAR